MNSRNATVLPANETDSFFARSPFRSVAFIALICFATAFVVADGMVLARGWEHLRQGEIIWLLILGLYVAVGGVLRIMRVHGQIRELFLGGSIHECSPGSPLALVLETCSRSLKNSMAFELVLATPYLWIYAYLAQHGR